MKPDIISFDGQAINDGVAFQAWIVSPSFSEIQAVADRTVGREYLPPLYVGSDISPRRLRIHIKPLGTLHSQVDTLKQWFNPWDVLTQPTGSPAPGLKALIIQDTADANRQWRAWCKASQLSLVDDRSATVMQADLLLPDGRWEEVVEISQTAAIAATPTNVAVNGVKGNVPTEPIIIVRPDLQKSGADAWARKRLAVIYNGLDQRLSSYPLNLVGTVWDTAALVAPASPTALINQVGGITASQTTIPYDTESPAGGFPSRGLLFIDTEQILYTGKTATDFTGATRGVNGTVAATHADNATIRLSKIQADGDDIRVRIDGREADRWLQDVNTANTKVWANIELPARAEALNDGAMGAADTSVTTKPTGRIGAFPPAGLLLIESELITYTSVSNVRNAIGTTVLKFEGLKRGVLGTTGAAHGDGQTIRWIPHIIEVVYDNPDAPAPLVDNSYQPSIELTSTNTAWTWNLFNSDAEKRPARWYRQHDGRYTNAQVVIPYTGNQGASASPWTEMGLKITKDNQPGALPFWVWRLDFAPLASSFQANGEYKMDHASDKIVMSCAYYDRALGIWRPLWALTHTTDVAFTAWSQSAVALPADAISLRFSLASIVEGDALGDIFWEVDSATLNLQASKVPQIAFNAEQASMYHFQAKILNTSITPNEGLLIEANVLLGQSLEIDCGKRTVKLIEDNTNRYGDVSLDTNRFYWLRLLPGNNTLQYTETGVVDIDLTVKHRGRAL